MHKTSFVVGVGEKSQMWAISIYIVCIWGCGMHRITHTHPQNSSTIIMPEMLHTWMVRQKWWCKREKQLKFREQFYSILSIGRVYQKGTQQEQERKLWMCGKNAVLSNRCNSFFFSLSSLFQFCCIFFPLLVVLLLKKEVKNKKKRLEITHHQTKQTKACTHKSESGEDFYINIIINASKHKAQHCYPRTNPLSKWICFVSTLAVLIKGGKQEGASSCARECKCNSIYNNNNNNSMKMFVYVCIVEVIMRLCFVFVCTVMRCNQFCRI